MIKLLLIASVMVLETVTGRLSLPDILSESENSDRPTALTPDDFVNLENFREQDIRPVISALVGEQNAEKDPLTRANKFEGDIAGHNKTEIHHYVRNSDYMGRSAVRNRWQLWPGGEVPYIISSRYGPYSRQVIAKVMDEYHTKTCIRFKPRRSEANYIYIYPDQGCYSFVGQTGGRQLLSLDAGCIQVGTIIHQFMHTIGFFHEHSRADRDDYIDIKWGNVRHGAEDQFEQYSLRTIQHLGTDYDYGSIMHLGAYAFSKRPHCSCGKTIIPKKSGGDIIGQQDGFSTSDLYKINKLYQCYRRRDCSGGSMTWVRRSGGSVTGAECEDTGWSNSRKRRGSPAVVASDCEDKRDHCSDWKSKGHCTKYISYMTRNCARICNLCEASAPSRGTSTREEQNRGGGENEHGGRSFKGECKDRDPHCNDWATSDKAYCTKHPAYMSKKCPKSCRICTSTATGENSVEETGGELGGEWDGDASCTNDNRKCFEYANNGYCTGTNKHVMERYCRKACGLC